MRLFSSRGDAPIAVEEIRLALSKFIIEKNELKSNSIESKLCVAINDLILERNGNPDSKDYEGLDDCAFTNVQIWTKCKLVMNGIDIVGRSESFYSIDYGMVTHKKISGLIQSKFKAVPFKTGGDNSKRGWRFQKEVINRIALQYTNELTEIKILSETAAQRDKGNTASDATDATHCKRPDGAFNETNDEISSHYPNQNTDKDTPSKQSIEQFVNNSSVHKNQDNISIDVNENVIDTSNNPANKSINNNNNNTIELTHHKGDCIQTESSPHNSSHNLSISTTTSNQLQLYSNIPYRPLKCDASDASDASHRKENQNGKTKAEEVGFPDIPCLYCAYKDPLDFDLSLHYIEKHRQHLIRLSLGKSSIDDRADYAVELSKR